jgi:deoxycytidylate deaminase
MFIYGHSYPCADCREAMKAYGIKKVYLMNETDGKSKVYIIDL